MINKIKGWTVYAHVNKINGKMYIGITSQSVKKRWGKNGNGYKPSGKTKNNYLWNAIEKYGWDIFDHEIIAENLSGQEAKNFEKTLIKELNTNNELYGYNISAGGDGYTGKRGYKGENIAGRKFNKITVLNLTNKQYQKNYLWYCVCDCGNTTYATAHALKSGHKKSCGCLLVDNGKSGVKNKKHGDGGNGINKDVTPLYSLYYRLKNNIKSNQKTKNISEFKEWKDYNLFKNWALKQGYCENLFCTRKDFHSDYTPENMIFVTKEEFIKINNLNKSNLYSFNNQTHTIKEWSVIMNIPYTILKGRLNNGNFTLEQALTTPVIKKRKE